MLQVLTAVLQTDATRDAFEAGSGPRLLMLMLDTLQGHHAGQFGMHPRSYKGWVGTFVSVLVVQCNICASTHLQVDHLSSEFELRRGLVHTLTSLRCIGSNLLTAVAAICNTTMACIHDDTTWLF